MDMPTKIDHGCCCTSGSGAALEVECENCGLDPMCDLLGYAEEGSQVPEGVLLRRCPVSRGSISLHFSGSEDETIFRKGDPFRSIFAVKSGSFKTYVPKTDKQDQVVGFHLAGELIGAEGLAGNAYPYTARALEDSSVCELRLEGLSETGRPVEALQQGIITLLGGEVAFNHELISTLVHQSADQRIAGFLLSLSTRLQRRGLPQSEFKMGMSRSDIGNYLGLASETVSRVLTRFQKSDFIRLNHKCLVIIDREALAAVAED